MDCINIICVWENDQGRFLTKLKYQATEWNHPFNIKCSQLKILWRSMCCLFEINLFKNCLKIFLTAMRYLLNYFLTITLWNLGLCLDIENSIMRIKTWSLFDIFFCSLLLLQKSKVIIIFFYCYIMSKHWTLLLKMQQL